MSAALAREHTIVMLGVHPASKERGGISTVIDVYMSAGLFARWPITYIGTFESGSAWVKARRAATGLWTYLQTLSTRRVALVHAHTASRASFWRKSLFILIAVLARKPVILHLHGAEFETFYYGESGPVRRLLIRFVLSRVDRVVVLSQQWRELVLRIAPAAKVVKIFNPVPPQQANVEIARSEDTLLFLGRFGRRKGVFDLIEALALIAAHVPGVRLRCGGDGDAEAVKARARELGVDDRLEMLGWVRGAAKERALAEAAVYVLPTYAEGLPMGVLEAMAAGAPVVTTPVGGIPDAIEDGVEGFMVAPGDTAALAERLVRLLCDAQLRRAMGAAAQRKAHDQFSVHKVLAQVEALYRTLGAAPRSTPEPDRRANGQRKASVISQQGGGA